MSRLVLWARITFIVSLAFLFSCSPQQNHAAGTPTIDTVVIRQMQFWPDTLNMKPGDTVVWINKDVVAHNITSAKEHLFYSDTIPVGNSWKMVVTDSAGYFCSIHPVMKGQLLIK
jgi:plastocyanin